MELRWEKPPHTTGKAFVADLNGEVYSGRYYVRRVAPHARKFVALRDGRYFAKFQYDSAEAAQQACELDADSPKSLISRTKELAATAPLEMV